MKAQHIIEELLAGVDIQVGGDRPWDIWVEDERLFTRIVRHGSLGAGEAYMDGWWGSERLDQTMTRIVEADLARRVHLTPANVLLFLRSRLANLQTRRRSTKVAERHYNLGNDLYLSFLDPYNQYTCGYFVDTDDLNEAQQKKMHMICRKLQIKASDRVLDIGCGWGGFARFAAENYGCHVTGVSISTEQVRYAREFCQGLPVSIEHKDYRDVQGGYDKIVVAGMIEHVGYRNYRGLFEKVHRVLQNDGLFLLHTIGRTTSATATDPWIDRYIFPNSMVPSLQQLSGAAEGLFIVEDLHNFGAQYDPTLMAWQDNLQRNWSTLADHYDDRTKRMFDYYLLSCAGTFRARKTQLWQMVMTKGASRSGYTRPQ
ncbi:MAG: cyclopropane-fatty-acyl-phospholipid synthase [Kiritimatiellia bacterium]|jgi:cyclopropane-fatty-acyl-phospholipid synthase